TQPVSAAGNFSFTLQNPPVGSHTVAVAFTSTSFANQSQSLSLLVRSTTTVDNVIVGDNLAVTDQLRLSATWRRFGGGFRDNLGITELIRTLRFGASQRTFQDNLGVSDSVLRLTTSQRIIQDTLGVTDQQS